MPLRQRPGGWAMVFDIRLIVRHHQPERQGGHSVRNPEPDHSREMPVQWPYCNEEHRGVLRQSVDHRVCRNAFWNLGIADCEIQWLCGSGSMVNLFWAAVRQHQWIKWTDDHICIRICRGSGVIWRIHHAEDRAGSVCGKPVVLDRRERRWLCDY